MNEEQKNQLREHASALIASLDENNQEKISESMNNIANMQESELFNQLGRLTRDFHETLNKFRSDERITSLTTDDIPDAKQRLNFVIEKTDEAAHKTMSAVECALPLCDRLQNTSKALEEGWEKFTHRELAPAEFRILSKELETFLSDLQGDTASVKSHLTDILMAQDFQDITGQIISRVIGLVDEVEKSLVELIKIGGKNVPAKVKTKEEKAEARQGELDGPQIPGMESAGSVSGQDEVDDLLSSLGF